MPPVEDARFAARRLLQATSHGPIRILAPSTGDGVAGAAILARALARAGHAFHAGFQRPDLGEPVTEADEGDVRLLLGLGAPDVPTRLPAAVPTFLVDVAPGPWPRDQPNLITYNPVHAGEPVAAASAATAAFALALAMDEANWTLAPLAFAGAIAAGADRPAFTGWTATARGEAVKRGALHETVRPDFDDEALIDVLALPPPLLAPLGRGYDHAQAVLREHGLPAEATVHELDEPGRQRWTSALALRLLRAGTAAPEVSRLAAPHLVDPGTGWPLARLASWLDIAAREDEAGLALGFALGDAQARNELETLEGRVRTRRRHDLRRLEAQKLDEGAALAVAGVAHHADVAPIARLWARHGDLGGRLVAIHAPLGHDVLVAVHAPTATTRIDVAALVTDAAAQTAGRGHGRADAAAARIPRTRFDEFLTALAGGLRVEAR